MAYLLIVINSIISCSHAKIRFPFCRKSATHLLIVYIISFFILPAVTNIVSIAAHPMRKSSDNVRVWAGTSNAGVWLFEHDNWTQLSNGLGNADVYSLQINPFDHKVLIAITSNGVFRTEDSGLNWATVTMPFKQTGWNTVYWDRSNQGDVVISGPDLGEVFNTDPRAAVSHDAGLNWSEIDLEIGQGMVAEARPGDVWGFAGQWYIMGNSFHNIVLGWPYHRRAFWRSSDRGDTWELLGTWPREQWDVDRHVTGLWSDPNHIFGTFDHAYANPIIESTSAGDTWIKGSQYLHTQRQILNDPVRPDSLWLIAQGELYVSSSGTSGFQKCYSLGRDMRAIAVDGYHGVIFAGGNNRRMAYSIDDGAGWIDADMPLAGPVTNDTHILSLAADQTIVSFKLVIQDIEATNAYISCKDDRTVYFKLTISDENGNPIGGVRLTGYDALKSDYYTTDGYSNVFGQVWYFTEVKCGALPKSYPITFKAFKDGYEDSEERIENVLVQPAVLEPQDISENYQNINLWRDLQVQNAQTILCPDIFPPGAGRRIGIIDWDFEVTAEGKPEHGTWAAQLAAGSELGNGKGFKMFDLPGIAASATLYTRSPWDTYRWSEEAYKTGCLLLNLTCGEMGDAIFNAFDEISGKVGRGGVIGFSMISWTWVQIPLPEPFVGPLVNREFLTVADALWFLILVQNYITLDNGIVVLPSNFFGPDVGKNWAVRQMLRGSSAIVAHAIKRGAVPVDECKKDDFYCATNREEINIAVPTTNNNNSIAVPAVAAVAALMKNANPNLSSKNIRDLLTNKTGIFKTVQINGTSNNVGILNAYEAVKAAMNFK